MIQFERNGKVILKKKEKKEEELLVTYICGIRFYFKN